MVTVAHQACSTYGKLKVLINFPHVMISPLSHPIAKLFFVLLYHTTGKLTCWKVAYVVEAIDPE